MRALPRECVAVHDAGLWRGEPFFWGEQRGMGGVLLSQLILGSFWLGIFSGKCGNLHLEFLGWEGVGENVAFRQQIVVV